MLRLLCVAALVVPAAAIANEPQAPVTTVTVATKSVDDGEKKVCRRVTTIGSNIPSKKVCVTRSEYEAAQRAARDEAEQMNSGGGHQSGN
ncbi:MAG TPA: hypothetical protein VK485_05665 [Sphingomicrobium sp.]|nr:hypothetical protein [Sphingomicrobium sp.]